MKFGMSLRHVMSCRFVLKFHKIRMGDDVIRTPFKLSPNNCPYLKYYWTYKLRTWNKYTTILHLSDNKNESDHDGRWRSQAKVKGHKNELMVICRKLWHSQTSYLVPRYNTISDIKWLKPIWHWLKFKVTTEGQRSKTWRCLRSLNASCFFLSFLE